MVQGPGDFRTVIVPALFFHALGHRLAESFGVDAAASVLYEIGRDSGRAFIREIERRKAGSLRNKRAILGLLRMFGKEFGWADIQLRSLDVDAKFAVVRWRHGVGVPYGGAHAPVCHLGRGLLSGAAQIIFEAPCDAIEMHCQATGSQHCEFAVGPADRIAEMAEGAQ